MQGAKGTDGINGPKGLKGEKGDTGLPGDPGYCRCFQVILYLIQKYPECKKGATKNFRDEKELKSKWAAKAGVVLVLMRIKFNNHN